ncbi:MAG: hypothetical protein EOM73_16670 [Bacteroidia bacterium]|nr:hypothetical protein [Bacteroidia bacterium]
MVDGVHGNTAVTGTTAKPSFSSRFAVFFKRLFIEKIGKIIVCALNSFAKLLKRIFGKVAKKFGLRREKVLFQGTDSVEYFYGESFFNKGEKKKKYKMPKWNDLEDNRVRTRFIYIKFLMKHIKKGWNFKAHKTPFGIAAEIADNPEKREIFDCYNLARYAQDCSMITDEVIVRILNTEENT